MNTTLSHTHTIVNFILYLPFLSDTKMNFFRPRLLLHFSHENMSANINHFDCMLPSGHVSLHSIQSPRLFNLLSTWPKSIVQKFLTHKQTNISMSQYGNCR